MPPRPPLDALPAGGLFLTFLAPSYRPPPTHSARRHLACSAALVSTAQPRQSPVTPQQRPREGGRRLLSGAAETRRSGTRLDDSEWGLPVASTSAVRLDSPPTFAPLPPHLAAPAGPSRPFRAEESGASADSAAVALPTVLSRLRELHKASPDASPLDLVRQLQPHSFIYDDAQPSPPTPPPPIVLDPQPHSSNPPLLTPFLLQALFLGASALGLLARKKVQKPRPSGTGVDQQSRREAEERVDEIQALNLLVGAWVLPEATEIETEKQLCAWREMAAEPVLGLVKGRAPGSANRSTLAGILSLTSRATDSSFQADFEPTRLALVDWSWRSFSAASPPTTVEVAVPVATHSDPLLHAFLSSIYPAGRVLDSAKSVRLVGANPDRAVLNGIARRLADPSVTPSDDLLASLAEAAMRAHRLDLLVSLLERDPPLPARLRLSLACKGVDILSRRRGQGDWRVEVVALVNGLTRAVEDMPSFEQADLDRLHRTLRHLVRGAYSGFALERRLASILLFVLRQSPEAAVQHDQFVTSGLRHLTQARHPRLAQRVLAAIPAPLVRLEHYEAVLSSSHAPTAQATFDALLRNDSLYPRLETFLAFLRSHASQTTSSASLQAAYRTICVMNWLDIPKTIDVYNLLFRVLARHGSDRALLRILRSMDEAGIKPNKETMAVLASREMVRRDTQTRRIVSHTALGEREVRLIERPRRGGAIAQQRKVAAAVREWEGKLAAVERTKEERDAEANKPPVAPNVLLKSIARWTREYQPAALVRLAKEQLGVDLAPLVADPKAKEAVVVRPPPHELTFAWYNTVRRPAYRLFATGLENRGERRLAEVLRRLARAEEKVVGALEAERRRAKKAGQGQEQPRRRRQEPEA